MQQESSRLVATLYTSWSYMYLYVSSVPPTPKFAQQSWTEHPLTPTGVHGYQWIGVWLGPRASLDALQKVNVFPLSGIESWVLSRPARGLTERRRFRSWKG